MVHEGKGVALLIETRVLCDWRMCCAAKRKARGAGNPGKPGKKLRLEDLQSQFGVGLKEAANRLGICPTTLKVHPSPSATRTPSLLQPTPPHHLQDANKNPRPSAAVPAIVCPDTQN